MNYLTQENEKRYLITSAWWQEWCDYANFDINQLDSSATETTANSRWKKEEIPSNLAKI